MFQPDQNFARSNIGLFEIVFCVLPKLKKTEFLITRKASFVYWVADYNTSDKHCSVNVHAMLRIKSGIRQLSWVVLVVFIMVLEWKNGIIYNCSYGKNQTTTNSISSPFWKFKQVCHYVKEYNSTMLFEHIQKSLYSRPDLQLNLQNGATT